MIVDFLEQCSWCCVKFVPGRGTIQRIRSGRKPYCSQSHAMKAAHYARQQKKFAGRKSAKAA